MEWISDNIGIVVAILFFIFSLLGKLRNGNEQKKPSRMPSFGGRDNRSEDMARRVQPRSATQYSSASGGTHSEEWDDEEDEDDGDDEYTDEPSITTEPNESYNYPATIQSLQNSSRESLDPEVIRQGMEARQERMQEELDRMHAHLDRSSMRRSVESMESLVDSIEDRYVRTKLAERVVQGVIWSEILGPPRAKRPMGRQR